MIIPVKFFSIFNLTIFNFYYSMETVINLNQHTRHRILQEEKKKTWWKTEHPKDPKPSYEILDTTTMASSWSLISFNIFIIFSYLFQWIEIIADWENCGFFWSYRCFFFCSSTPIRGGGGGDNPAGFPFDSVPLHLLNCGTKKSNVEVHRMANTFPQRIRTRRLTRTRQKRLLWSNSPLVLFFCDVSCLCRALFWSGNLEVDENEDDPDEDEVFAEESSNDEETSVLVILLSLPENPSRVEFSLEGFSDFDFCRLSFCPTFLLIFFAC